jgi:hypothetical protein
LLENIIHKCRRGGKNKFRRIFPQTYIANISNSKELVKNEKRLVERKKKRSTSRNEDRREKKRETSAGRIFTMNIVLSGSARCQFMSKPKICL